jgi:flagellar biosynthesis protein FlhG
MDEIRKKLWAVGGGKGGCGKSIVTLMLGASLAKLGMKVILVDADLGGSNLHTLSGIRYPTFTLADFISRRVETIDEVVMDTPIEDMKIICGADDILGIANPKYTQKARLFSNIMKLDADIIILDLGAGTSFTTIDFFNYAQNKIVVLTPQMTSLQNAYGFIKSSLYRSFIESFKKEPEILELIGRASASVEGEKIDSVARLYEQIGQFGAEQQERLMNCIKNMNIKIIANMVRDAKEKNVSHIIKSVAKNYLSLDLEELGVVHYDNMLNASINNMTEYLVGKQDTVTRGNFYDIAYSIVKNSRTARPLMFPATAMAM